MATYKEIETNENGIVWFEIKGIDSGTGYDFGDGETFGLTDDDQILDCDGCPLVDDDRYQIAVSNTIESLKNKERGQ